MPCSSETDGYLGVFPLLLATARPLSIHRLADERDGNPGEKKEERKTGSSTVKSKLFPPRRPLVRVFSSRFFHLFFPVFARARFYLFFFFLPPPAGLSFPLAERMLTVETRRTPDYQREPAAGLAN